MRSRFNSVVGKLPWRREWLPTPVNLELLLVAQVVKKPPAMQETRARSLGWADPWRRAWQPTPVVLPGESPWTVEPGGLQSVGLQRAGRNWTFRTNHTAHIRLYRASPGKESACNTVDSGDAGSVPGLGRSPGEGNGSPPPYSCLQNPMDRGDWWATVHGVAKSRTWLRRQHEVIRWEFPGGLEPT